MKRIISILLSVIMALSISFGVCGTAFAEGDIITQGETVYSVDGTEKTKLRKSLRKAAYDPDDYRYASNIEECYLIVRDALVRRDKKLNLYVPWDDFFSSDDNISTLTQKARYMRYSSSGQDGDYLLTNSLIKSTRKSGTYTIDDKYYFFIEYEFTYRTDAEQEKQVTEKINSIKPSLIKDTDYDTLKAIHDYLCDNMTYDNIAVQENSTTKSTAYMSLIKQRAVCSGYASTFYRIAKELGFNVRYVRSESINHAWDAVELGGKWYYIDCTWDDNDDAVNSDNSTVTNQNTIYDYFLKGSSDFLYHTADDITFGYWESDMDKADFSETGYVPDSTCVHDFTVTGYRNSKCSGLYTEVQTCSKCNATKSTVIGSSDSHNEKSYSGYAPTCQDTGYSESVYCKDCNVQIKDRTELGTIDHKLIENVEKAKYLTNGTVTKYCEYCGAEYAVTRISGIYSVTASGSKYTYNGSNKRPAVTAKDASGKAIPSKYYTVTYPKDSKNVGTYKVNVKFRNYYDYTCSFKYTVVPKGTALGKIKAANKAFTVNWSKQKTQTSGYQVQCSLNGSFTKSVKTVNVKGNSKTSAKVKGLKKKKKYYVRIRTYKVVNGNTYYSNWSKVKTVKTK